VNQSSDRAAVDGSVQELRLRLRQQELVAGFGRFALRTDSLQEILDEASRTAAEGLDSRFAKVLEYLPGDMAFVVRAGVGWHDGVVGQARVGGDLLSPAGYAFRTGNPVISNHLAAEQRFRTPQLLVDNRIRSAINVLIQARDSKPFGVLEGDSTNRGDFNNHDVTFLEALANSLAVAVEAQRRQDAREQLLREKEALLAENLLLLKEKDLLMQEVHHRVTNSLQLVRTILIMQARRLTNSEAKEQVEEAAGRIMTIAAVHQRLYDGGSITATDAAQYLRGLLADMKGALLEHASDRAVDLDIEPFMLGADDVTPLGLITGELVTNALKHGRGNVRVAIRRDAGGVEVAVSDEGTGFPAGFDPMGNRGLGMRLVAAIARTPDGDAIQIDRSVPFGRVVVRTPFGSSDPSAKVKTS
jgi:two-component sensor histidine kinase